LFLDVPNERRKEWTRIGPILIDISSMMAVPIVSFLSIIDIPLYFAGAIRNVIFADAPPS